MAIHAITLAFANEAILERSIEAFHTTRNPDLRIDRHVIVDQHYPLRYEVVRACLDRLAVRFPTIEIVDPGRNLGLHDGFNWALKALDPHDDDIVIGYDGDSLPIKPGWDMALVRALSARRRDQLGSIVWSSLANPRTIADIKLRGYDRVKVDGYLELWLTRTAITNSVCAWRVGWLRKVGWLQEPKAFYGHLESTMWGKLAGNRWAVIPDWPESDELRKLHDRLYVIYKWRHSHLSNWPGDFASFIDHYGDDGDDEAAPKELP